MALREEAGGAECAEQLLKLPRAGGWELQSQLLKMRLKRAAACVHGWVLPGELLMKMRHRQVAREVAAWEVAGGVAAREVAWESVSTRPACPSQGLSAREAARESGSSARPACPSPGLLAATHPPHSKADHQSQGRLQGFHGRSVGFAPRVGQAL